MNDDGYQVQFGLRINTDDVRLIRAIASADALSSVIRGIHIAPHVRSRLDRLNIVRTVRATTAIEGNLLPEAEVARVLASRDARGGGALGWDRDVAEVRNAERAMQLIAQTLERSPDERLTETLVCRINEVLTAGIDYQDHLPGRYRAHAVRVGPFVPPRSPQSVRRLMAELIEWLYGAEALGLHPIVRALVAHFYLVTIHPFGDGNGRTSRAVESFLLYQASINAFGFYSLANFYYKRRDEYFHELNQARLAADLTPFVLFAAEGLVTELQSVQREVLAYLEVLAFRDHAREALRRQDLSARTRQRMLDFVDLLGDQPSAVSAIRLGRHPISRLYRDTSIRTMERDVAMLERLGLIRREDAAIAVNVEVLEAQRRAPFDD